MGSHWGKHLGRERGKAPDYTRREHWFKGVVKVMVKVKGEALPHKTTGHPSGLS